MKRFTTLLFSLLMTAFFAEASYYYDPGCECGLDVYADFLFLKAKGDNLDYANVLTGTRDTTLDPTEEKIKARFLEVDPSWKPGVRLGAVKELNCYGLHAFAEWTWYQVKESQENSYTRADTDEAFLEINSPFIGNTGGTSTSTTSFTAATMDADFLFQMNRFDIGIGSDFCFSDWLHFNPHIAFTYARFKQELRIDGNFTNEEENPFLKESIYDFEGVFTGYGLKFGLATLWKVYPCWELYSNINFTYLMGDYDVCRRLTIDEGGGAVSPIIFREGFVYHDDRQRAYTDFQLGLRFNSKLCDEYPVYAQIGWEYHVLFDQTDWMVRAGQIATDGNKDASNLYLQGLVVRAGFGF